MSCDEEFRHVWLNNRHQAGIHSIHLARVDVHPHDRVPFRHQASRTDRSHVTQTKDRYVHSGFMSICRDYIDQSGNTAEV